MSAPDTIVDFGSPETWTRVAVFLVGAFRRRWVRVAAFAVLFLSVGVAAAALLPRAYSAESRLLVRKNYVMPALAHPKRAVPIGADSLTQSAAEFVLSRQSLRSLVTRYDLVNRWDRERPGVLALKDWAIVQVKGPMPLEDKTDAIIELLAKRIRVSVEDEVVRVHATWSDRRTVVDIVNGAVEEFLEARRKIDIQTVADTAEILTKAAEAERARVEEQLAVVAAARQLAPRPTAGRTIAPAPRAGARSAGPTDGALGGLRARILGTQASRAAIEKSHADQIEQLRAKIAERRTLLTERHPEVLSLRRALDGLSVEPAALAEARRQEAELVAEYAARGGNRSDLEARGETGGARADSDADERAAAILARGSELLLPAAKPDEEDDTVAYQRSLLKSLIANYEDLQDRLANVHVELQTAQAAFPYRYSVTTPTRLPKKADSPNVPILLIGALLAGCFAGAASAVFAELRAQALTSPAAVRQFLVTETA